VSVTVTVDASTTVSVTSPMREARVRERRPELRGTAEPGATITLVFDTGERATVTADAMGNWSFTPTMELSVGENSVQITAQDRAGNTATERHIFVVVGSTPDAGVDASADGALPSDGGADSAMATDAAASDGASDAAAIDSSLSDVATLPRGTLEGSGACGCAVVGKPSALGGRSALLLAAAAMVSAACARRNRRRS
jgi:large repetitive protein